MSVFVLVTCRLLLAAVFALAAGTKLADRPATRVAVLGFGVPESLATVALWALIAGELVTAGLLLPAGTAWFGALAALGMLLVFCVAAGINMARGKAPECNCFGQIHSEPIGPKLFVRNAGFALLAGVIVAAGRGGVGPGIDALLGKLSEAEALLGALVVVLAAAVMVLSLKLRAMAAIQAGLAESVARLGQRGAGGPREYPPGLPVGAAAPEFELFSAEATVSLGGLLKAGKPTLLIFISPRCGACQGVLQQVKEWREHYGSKLSFAVVTNGNREANKVHEDRTPGEPLLFEGDEIARAYKVSATPGGVIVGADGKIQAEMKYGIDKITGLLSAAVGEPPAPEVPAPASSEAPLAKVGRGLALGTVAPAFELVSAAGTVPFPGPAGKGKPLFLLFTSPASVDSGEAIAKVQRWQAMHGDRVGFAVMTTGDGLKLEGDGVSEARTTVGAFQVGEVPAAVLLGADGTLLSETAFGMEEIVVLFLSDVAAGPPATPVKEVSPAAPAAYTLVAYLKWHAATLAALENSPSPASGKLEALVWSPRAGLGDSIQGFAGWMRLAMRTGRLLFADLDGGGDRTWRLGLACPALDWDFSRHRVSLDQNGIAVLPVSGHPAIGQRLVEEAAAFPEPAILDQALLLRSLIAPSDEVQAILAEQAAFFEGRRVLGLQLRTGTALPPDPAYLQPGEEAEFVSAAVELTREGEGDPWRVLVISDDEGLKSRMIGMLAEAGLDVFSMESSVLHTGRDTSEALEDEAVRQRLLRTCAEFFLFSQVDSAVITARSLFGRTALAYGGVVAKREVGS